MLVDSFAAVSLEAVDLPDLQWSGVATLLHGAVAQSASAGDTSAEDGTKHDPDSVACLRVSGSTVASLHGLAGYQSLLAFGVPRNGLSDLGSQVCNSALASLSSWYKEQSPGKLPSLAKDDVSACRACMQRFDHALQCATVVCTSACCVRHYILLSTFVGGKTLASSIRTCLGYAVHKSSRSFPLVSEALLLVRSAAGDAGARGRQRQRADAAGRSEGVDVPAVAGRLPERVEGTDQCCLCPVSCSRPAGEVQRGFWPFSSS